MIKTRLYSYLILLICLPFLFFSCGAEKSKDIETMDPQEIRQGPIVSDTLSSLQLTRIDYLYNTFKEVDPTSKEKWIDDFKRDRNPDKEIEIWEMMANAYNSYCNGKAIDLNVKKEVFEIVLVRSTLSEMETLKKIQLKFLNEEQAKQIMKAYTLDGKPIEVMRK